MATKNYRKKLQQVTTFILDYDGVLTNGNIYLGDNGLIIRQGNVKDGYAIQLALKKGYQVIVLSGSKDENIRIRCEFFKIPYVFLGVSEKARFLERFIEEKKLIRQELLYMGDDIPDFLAKGKPGQVLKPNLWKPIRQNFSFLLAKEVFFVIPFF